MVLFQLQKNSQIYFDNILTKMGFYSILTLDNILSKRGEDVSYRLGGDYTEEINNTLKDFKNKRDSKGE